MQMQIANMSDIHHVFWWKTYSPPIWLLNGKITDVQTGDFMGAPVNDVITELEKQVQCGRNNSGVVLVAPASALALDEYTNPRTIKSGLLLTERMKLDKHINLDDLDFAEDGVYDTLKRVWGRKGLVLWDVEKKC